MTMSDVAVETPPPPPPTTPEPPTGRVYLLKLLFFAAKCAMCVMIMITMARIRPTPRNSHGN